MMHKFILQGLIIEQPAANASYARYEPKKLCRFGKVKALGGFADSVSHRQTDRQTEESPTEVRDEQVVSRVSTHSGAIRYRD